VAGKPLLLVLKASENLLAFGRCREFQISYQENLSSEWYDTLAGQENISLLPVHGQWNL
jgi:hypothetical protein